MRKSASLALLFALSFKSTALRAAEPPMQEVIRDSLAFAAEQDARMLESIKGKEGFPRTFEHGKLALVPSNDWTSGFLAGSFWFVYESTREPKWLDAAAKLTARLEPAKDVRTTHDVGFILNSSQGNGLRLTGDKHYKDILIAGAESLSTRFNPKVGSIKSWDNRPAWPFPVIIDNMMNLELLLKASRLSGNPLYRDIAIAHADTTMRNHFRPDGSSFHVVDYDPATGKVTKKQTHQGVADDSAWSRGQAWGLYGFTMMYRETQEPRYLAHAQKIATFLLNHPRMPVDKIPYWDFDAPGIPNVPRDASAAAVMSSALLELSTFVSPDTARHYTEFAEQQLRSLSSSAYRAKAGENGNFIIMHCTGNLPKGSEIDGPLSYGDYYYLEALLRAKARLERKI